MQITNRKKKVKRKAKESNEISKVEAKQLRYIWLYVHLVVPDHHSRVLRGVLSFITVRLRYHRGGILCIPGDGVQIANICCPGEGHSDGG